MTKKVDVRKLAHNSQMVIKTNDAEEGRAFGKWASKYEFLDTCFRVVWGHTFVSETPQLISFGDAGSSLLCKVDSAEKKTVVEFSDFIKDPEYYLEKYKEDMTGTYIIMAIILAPIIFLVGWLFCGLWEITDGNPITALIGAAICIRCIC